MKKTANSLFLPVNGMLLFLALSCSVSVDRGPYPIEEDAALIHGKEKYLDSLRKSPPGPGAPNIILILADDLGKHDISLYDPSGVRTPQLEKLAAKGICYQRAYCSSSVCSPSRAGLLTGRYPQRFGYERQPMNRYAHSRLEYWVVDHLIDKGDMELIRTMSKPSREEMMRQGIPAGEILLSELFSAAGYSTAIMGKWHLGHEEAFLPNNSGFDRQFGFYEAFSRYVPPDNRDVVEHRHDYFANRHIWRQKRKGSCAIREDHRVVEDTAYLTFSIARRACRFMEEQRDHPFFLYLPFSAPHTPFQVPLEYYNRFPDEKDHNKRVYKGMIAALDDAVGMVTEQVAALGLEDNTLIVFASDNGGATYTEATDNGPLKAGKFSQFEGGIRIPMILSWPGRSPSGIESDLPVSLMDIFTTSTAAAGISLPADRALDGLDLLEPGMTPFTARPLFWRTDFNKSVMVFPWKLVWNERDGQHFLYRLDRDQGEKQDLSGIFTEKVKEMKELFLEWESEMKDPLWPGVMEFHFRIDGAYTGWAL